MFGFNCLFSFPAGNPASLYEMSKRSSNVKSIQANINIPMGAFLPGAGHPRKKKEGTLEPDEMMEQVEDDNRRGLRNVPWETPM
ncbi:small muscular protein isoform X3 [Stegostoma tigrinum]|uniref:small muscular protein isoform X3 n=1 Tax=Stegostoma tigrinum TaxID=3053191 RepID=UPI00202B151F|nr:small muscular protein isoform X3 [Stegostoma tigrinum]